MFDHYSICFKTGLASSYSGQLTGNSSIYSRIEFAPPTYYFETIRVTVSRLGTYTFTSNSSFDCYGYLYNGSFNASYPFIQKVMEDDNGNGNGQFLMTTQLQTNVTYNLVITASLPYVIGWFLIIASGPSSIRLDRIYVPSAAGKQHLFSIIRKARKF